MSVAADTVEVVDPEEVEYDKSRLDSTFLQTNLGFRFTIFSYKEENGRWRFKPRGLHITWGNKPEYWKMPDKGTDDPAELKKVTWLEIKSSTPQPLSKGERYALSFKISLKDDHFGWSNVPAFMLAKVGKKGRAKWVKIDVAAMGVNEEIMEVPQPKLLFDVPKNAEDTVLYFGFYELWTGRWKGGLRIHEAVVEEMPG